MQSLMFIIFMVSKKIAMFKFLAHLDNKLDVWPVEWPNINHYINSHFSCELKTERDTKHVEM